MTQKSDDPLIKFIFNIEIGPYIRTCFILITVCRESHELIIHGTKLLIYFTVNILIAVKNELPTLRILTRSG